MLRMFVARVIARIFFASLRVMDRLWSSGAGFARMDPRRVEVEAQPASASVRLATAMQLHASGWRDIWQLLIRGDEDRICTVRCFGGQASGADVGGTVGGI